MTRVRVEYRTNASPQACWALMADFANIDFFNPAVKNSHLVEGSPTACGVGTQRHCDLENGMGYIREKVVDWQEGRSYTVEIYDGTMPIERTLTTLGLEPDGNGGTMLYMVSDYTPKFGWFGRIVDPIMLRPMLTGMLRKVIIGLADKAGDAVPLESSASAAA